MSHPFHLSDEQWREKLSPEQYRVLREAGTEPPFTGKYLDQRGQGTYACAGCGQPLFHSDNKYDSGTGWPSFWAPIEGEAIEERRDLSLLEARVEARCSRCGSHLGHIFSDGPPPTRLRYCINSLALQFQPDPHER